MGFPPYKSVSVSFRILSADLLPKTLADIAGIIGNHEPSGDFVELHGRRLDGVAVEEWDVGVVNYNILLDAGGHRQMI